MKTEPVITIASLQAVIVAILGALVAFNVWVPTDAQKAAILGVYAVVAPLVFAFYVRTKVTPTA